MGNYRPTLGCFLRVVGSRLGALDGKNDWKDVEKITMFGLPYRNNFSAILQYFSLVGEQSDAWLRNNGDKPSDRILTLKRINRGFMVSSIIQAINRCQIRKPDNTDGHCKKTDIYILLPSDKESKFIIDEIKSQMPNLQIKHWEYGSAKDGRKGSAYLQSVLGYLKDHKDKSIILLKDIETYLKIPAHAFRRIKRTLKDPNSPLSRTLDELILVYRFTGATNNIKQWLEPQQSQSIIKEMNIKMNNSYKELDHV